MSLTQSSLMSVSEFAAAIGKAERQVYRYVKRGQISVLTEIIHGRTVVRIPCSEVERLTQMGVAGTSDDLSGPVLTGQDRMEEDLSGHVKTGLDRSVETGGPVTVSRLEEPFALTCPDMQNDDLSKAVLTGQDTQEVLSGPVRTSPDSVRLNGTDEGGATTVRSASGLHSDRSGLEHPWGVRTGRDLPEDVSGQVKTGQDTAVHEIRELKDSYPFNQSWVPLERHESVVMRLGWLEAQLEMSRKMLGEGGASETELRAKLEREAEARRNQEVELRVQADKEADLRIQVEREAEARRAAEKLASEASSELKAAREHLAVLEAEVNFQKLPWWKRLLLAEKNGK